jgi:hypothetical protein
MHQHLVLAQKLQHALIEVHLAEEVQFAHAFDGQVAFRAVFQLQQQGVLVALQGAVAVDVEASFHGVSSSHQQRS